MRIIVCMVMMMSVLGVDMNNTQSKFCKKECDKTCVLCYDICTGDVCKQKCDTAWSLCNDICDFIPI
jgi:hypothetical protein